MSYFCANAGRCMEVSALKRSAHRLLLLFAIALLAPLASLHAQTIYYASDPHNAVMGTATRVTYCPGCLNGTRVADIGFGHANYLRIKHISVPTTGTYGVKVYYVMGPDISPLTRNLRIQINDGYSRYFYGLSGNNWLAAAPIPISFAARFTAGNNNSLGFFGDYKGAPSIDHIEVFAPSAEVGVVTTGVWNATPLTAAYLPSDVVYADHATSFSNSLSVGTSSPVATLSVQTTGTTAGTAAQINGTGQTAAGLILNNNNPAFTNSLLYGYTTATGNGFKLLDLRASSGTDQVMSVDGAGDGYFQGNVGIGTTSPGASLEVHGNVKLSYLSGSSITFQDGSVQNVAWNGTLSGGDYAEAIDVLGDRAAYEPGDVIVINPTAAGKFDKSASSYSRLVAGVFSTKPGLVGRRSTAARPDKQDEVPMAMMGIVPTKVSAENGPIAPGDLLVSANTPGYAMKGTDTSRLTGAVIGKALAPLNSGSGVIEVLISLQ